LVGVQSRSPLRQTYIFLLFLKAEGKTTMMDKEDAQVKGPTSLDSGSLPGEAPIPNLTHKRMLLDKGLSDLYINFKERKNPIYAHSYVIWVRADGLLPAKEKQNLEKKKKKKDPGVVSIEVGSGKEMVFSPRVTDLVFEYIYNGHVKFSTISKADILFLTVAAKQYKLDRLSYLCESYLKDTLSLENVHQLLKLAHDQKEATVKNLSLAFAVKHYSAFISNKTGVNDIGLDLFREVAQLQASPSEADINLGNPPPNQYLAHWQHLHDEMLFSDGVAKLGNEKIRFHKAVLGAHSEALGQFLKSKESEEVTFPGISAEAFKAMLRFIYFGAADVGAQESTELINFCKQYDMNDLAKVCEDKIRGGIANDTVLDILGVTYLPYMQSRPDMQELRRKAMTYLLEHFTAIDLQPLRKMNPPTIALDVLFACQAHEAKQPLPEATTNHAPMLASITPRKEVPPPGASSPHKGGSSVNLQSTQSGSNINNSEKGVKDKDNKKDKKKDEKKDEKKDDKKDKKKDPKSPKP